jgi:hypothetical protein
MLSYYGIYCTIMIHISNFKKMMMREQYIVKYSSIFIVYV